jgi:hypothetical protein
VREREKIGVNDGGKRSREKGRVKVTGTDSIFEHTNE